ncbi:MAG: M20/M25/M40 family metallo-hydrolase [Actinocatenispora sp.]
MALSDGALSLDRARALATLTRMVRFDSRTETPQESEICGWLVDQLAELGLDAELVEVGPHRANAVGVWRGSGGAPSLMFNGHVDTNPLTEGWTRDPWGGEVDGNVLYGLGVSNMKAGCAAYLEAVRALRDAGWRPRGDVVLTFVVGELQNGIGTRALLEQGWRADHFVNCEPTDLAALTTHAGSATFEVQLVGATRHMSKREEAHDALAAAARVVPVINRMTFSGAVDADAERTNRAHVGVFRAGLGRELLDTRPPQVADVARLVGSVRYGPGQNAETVLRDLREAVEQTCGGLAGVSGTVRRVGDDGPSMDRPFHVARDTPVARTLNDSYELLRGASQPTGAIQPYCYYGSDASLLQHLGGMSGVVCGPGGRYNTMPDERVEITDYLDAIRLYMRTLDRICG